MIKLSKKLNNSNTPHEKKVLSNQINNIDKKIDAMIYKLYCLNEKEINLIEYGLIE
jgi:hypothetical protein